jgi:small subunit ribosomal protein S7
MSRRHAAPQRKVLPDPKFKNPDVAKFMNFVMIDGKKFAAEKVVYGALDIIQQKTKMDPVELMLAALENIRPLVEVKSRRVGGATYQVPVEVTARRGKALAMRMVKQAAEKRTDGKTMTERLARELLDAKEGRGTAIKKKEDMHKMADANKAFAHFRW